MKYSTSIKLDSKKYKPVPGKYNHRSDAERAARKYASSKHLTVKSIIMFVEY